MTEIAKPVERPRWASDVSADVIAPSVEKQDTGWVQEYPPLQYFNWLGKYTYEWLDYLERNSDASLGGGGAVSPLSIASGVITPTTGIVLVDTEAAAATDDLTTLAITDLADGRVVILRSVDAARVITVKHMAGGNGQISLRSSADIVLDDPKKALILIRNGNKWDELMGFLGSDSAPYLSADLDVRTKKIFSSVLNGDVIIEPDGTGSLSPLTTGKALGKSAQRWNAFLSGANVAGDISPEADGTRSLGSTGTRWGSAFADQISATDWVRTAALDTESLGGTLAIGGTNASIINIGRTGATVNLYGSITEVHTTNTYVTDKLLTLNDGGLAASGDGAGIEIEEDGSATAYVKVSSNRNKWSFKAPNNAAVVSIGAEATVVGDIGLVSNVLTFMAGGFSFKNSAGNPILGSTDAGVFTVTGPKIDLAAGTADSEINLRGNDYSWKIYREYAGLASGEFRIRYNEGGYDTLVGTRPGAWSLGALPSGGSPVTSGFHYVHLANINTVPTNHGAAWGLAIGGNGLAGTGLYRTVDFINYTRATDTATEGGFTWSGVTTGGALKNFGFINNLGAWTLINSAGTTLTLTKSNNTCQIKWTGTAGNDFYLGQAATSSLIFYGNDAATSLGSVTQTAIWTLGTCAKFDGGSSEITFFPDVNSDRAMLFNYVGYNGGTTRARAIFFYDGKNNKVGGHDYSGYWAHGIASPSYAIKKLSGTWLVNTNNTAISHGLSQARIKKITGSIAIAGVSYAIPGPYSGLGHIQVEFDGSNVTLRSYGNTLVPLILSTVSDRDYTLYVFYEAS